MWHTCPLCHGSYDDDLVNHFCQVKANVSNPVILTCPECHESYPALTIHICKYKKYKMLEPAVDEAPKDWSWILWLLGILFLLSFCGRQAPEQEPQRQPQQNQRSFNTPALAKAIT